LGPCGRTSIYQEKPSRGRKPIVQPLWPRHYTHGRSPLRACRRLNHCFHLPGGELAIENIKNEKGRKKRERKKRKRKRKEEDLGRRIALLWMYCFKVMVMEDTENTKGYECFYPNILHFINRF
jgi:hypothetical protein